MEVVDLVRGRRANGLLPGGAHLGRYEVIRLLSVGGMAEIYLARSEGVGGFEKRVVIKRMLPHFAIQPDYVRMFLAEARLAARLEHPNIVSVHDIGEDTGNYHYAMEYVKGGDLRDLLRAAAHAGEAVPLGVAVGIALGVCAGLDHAHNATDGHGHSLEVVHRDVSLSNVLVSFDGAVKVTDFGVAKMDEADHRTRTGTLKGKVAYMSPEQCRGLALDRRSDVFAIGILLYELVTCRRLFGGGGELVTLQRIVREDAPSASHYRPTCPPALDEIIARALARDRDKRYASAREMGRDLDALVRSERLASSPSEIAAFVRLMIGAPPTGTRLGTDTRTFDADLDRPAAHHVDDVDHHDDEDAHDKGIISVELVPYESAPVAAAPDVRPPPRKPTIAASAASRWDVAIRYGALALVAVAIIVVFFGRGSSSPPLQRPPTVGSFEPPPAAMRPAASVPAPPPTPKPKHAPPAVVPEADAGVAVATIGPDNDTDTDIAIRGRHHEHSASHRERASRTPPAADAGAANEILDPFPVAVARPPPTESPPPVSRPPPADPPPPRSPPTPPSSSPSPSPSSPSHDSQPPQRLDAVASLSRVEVQGPLQASELRRALERVMPAVRYCYQTAATRARRTPKLDIRISFQIDDTRAARSVHASNTSLVGLSACVADAVGRARTRVAPDVGNAEADVVITFVPR